MITEGGGLRGVFATGILDRFLEIGFDPFDLFIGVSSGAGNIASFMARMPKRNLLIYTSYSLAPEFISLKKFFRGGHLMDLDWMWKETICDIRLDLKTIYRLKRPFIVTLTDVKTGGAIYKTTDEQNLEDVLKAASALPVLYRGFPKIEGRSCTDGGIADPVPIREAIRLGAQKIMVLRSRPRPYRKKEKLTQVFLWLALHRFPALSKAVALRVPKYNRTIDFIQHPDSQASIIEVCPPDDFDISRFNRNRSQLLKAYLQGKKAGDRAVRDWEQKENVL